jgi:hypothetical protein
MVLKSTQPVTEMNTRDISLGVKRPVRKADELTCQAIKYTEIVQAQKLKKSKNEMII